MANATTHIGNTREKIAEVAHQAAEQVSERTDQIKRNVRETAVNAEKQLRDAADKAKVGGEQMAGTIQQFVDKHPILSVTVAVGVGVVLLTALVKREAVNCPDSG